jgi:hypothetical protein
MIARVILFCILLAAAVAVIGFVLAGAWQLGLPAAGLGGLWIAARRKGWGGAASPLLLGFITLAALGVTLPGGAVWAPLCLVAALAAWDLDRFAGRLRAVGPRPAVVESGEAAPDETHDLVRRHLLRLGVVSALGLTLSWVGQAIHFKLDLTVMLLLGFVAILGLSRVVRSLVRESD